MRVQDISYIAYDYILHRLLNIFFYLVDPKCYEMYPRHTNKVKGMFIIRKYENIMK